MYRRVLLCSDGSEDALNAARAAAQVVRQGGASLTVLFVSYVPVARSLSAALPRVYAELGEQLTHAESQKHAVAARTEAVLDAERIAYSARHQVGDAADVILDTIAAEQCDLVVLGGRGRSPFRAFRLGSVADRVCRHAPCSVLLVR